ncbi:hypothetical protein [Candidatus Magnetominusculus xianensis]|uniref:Uncharacterized protein n=1 Tax=Candidatus Magnetominusculus xianensis TaxID=1748249 RepID=A0ABR5SDI9_9BACT|nr:hypothetical protein [Candidatus Magnetominusculus xianensis]KWT81131.1 hypothetical protein ASN18_2637 [Candidatus Magnetominusculus xianensis]MBF0402961.1 hypothetical protein [Nitrospirota bacterium]
MRIEVADITANMKQKVYWAQIKQIDASNDTADVEWLDDKRAKTGKTQMAVPIFYHCGVEVQKRSNGALEGAASAFTVNDEVVVVFTDDNYTIKEPRIIGFIDGKKACGLNLILLVIDDDEFLTPEDDIDKIKYYTYEYGIRKPTASVLLLTKKPTVTANISRDGDGLVLVMQGSENKNANAASLPNKFTYFEFWDIKDDGSDCRWGATVLLFYEWSCLMGSNRAWNPIDGLTFCISARTNFKIITDNQTTAKTITAKAGEAVTLNENIKALTVKKWDGSTGYAIDSDYTVDFPQGILTVKSGGAIPEGESVTIGYSYLTMTCYYKIHQILLQPPGLFYDDTLQPTHRTPSRYEMLYKTNPGGQFIGSALIALEYETGNPFSDGYEWKIYNPVVAISDTEALVISKKREQVESPFAARLYDYTADFTGVLTEWGVCFEPGQCFIGGQNHYGKGRVITSVFRATGTVSLTKQHIKYTEELTIGDEVVLSLVKEIKSESNFNNGDGISIQVTGGLVSEDIQYACALQDDGHMCFMWDTTCPESFSGGVTSGCEAISRAFPVTDGTCGAWGHPSQIGGPIVVPGGAVKSSIVGAGGIHVMGMANSEGKKNRIVIYQYTDYAIYHNIDGTTSSTTATKYVIDMKTTAVTSQEIVAVRTVHDDTASGNSISRVSCQINAGILTYTYCKYNAAGAFISRKIGIINISNTAYPIGAAYATEAATDMEISTSNWSKMIAIGITK